MPPTSYHPINASDLVRSSTNDQIIESQDFGFEVEVEDTVLTTKKKTKQTDIELISKKKSELELKLLNMRVEMSENEILGPVIRGIDSIEKILESHQLWDEHYGLLIANFECPEKAITCLDYAAGDKLFYHLIESSEVEKKLNEI